MLFERRSSISFGSIDCTIQRGVAAGGAAVGQGEPVRSMEDLTWARDECQEQLFAGTESTHSNGKPRVSVCYMGCLSFFFLSILENG